MIKAIILDCFGVLYTHLDEGFFRAKVKDYERHKDELADLVNQADYGLISQAELITAVAELAGLEERVVAEGIIGRVARNEQLLDYAQSLRPKVKLGLLSNISIQTMDEFFTPQERARLFDDVVLSSEVGMIKPHPAIYELAARRLGVDTSEVVMVDDSGVNCDGAREAGMVAILYRDFETTKREIELLIRKTQD